jgi:hypothetical protein
MLVMATSQLSPTRSPRNTVPVRHVPPPTEHQRPRPHLCFNGKANHREQPQILALPAWRELGSYRLRRITRFRRQEKVFTRGERLERISSLDLDYK